MENMKISYNLILAAWHLEEREIDLDFFYLHLFWL